MRQADEQETRMRGSGNRDSRESGSPAILNSRRLVWKDRREALDNPGWNDILDYRVLSAILFATMALLSALFA
jgi:hypothetical protein